VSWVVAILLAAGAFFAFIAALGVNRLPDFYMRLHAATKAGAFGASLLLVAAALHFGSLRACLSALLIIVFFLPDHSHRGTGDRPGRLPEEGAPLA